MSRKYGETRMREVGAYVEEFWDQHGRVPGRQLAAADLGLHRDYYSGILAQAVREGIITRPGVIQVISRRIAVREENHGPGAISRGNGCSADMARKIVNLLLTDAGCALVGIHQLGGLRAVRS